MKRILSLLVLLLVIASAFGMGGRPKKPVPTKPDVIKSERNPTLVRTKTGLVEGGESGIFVVKVINHREKEKIHLERALDKVKEVVASKCFEEKLLKRLEPNKDRMRKTNGLTNAQVIADIRKKSVEIEVEMYSKWGSKVKGYTYPSTNRIWTNRKFHNGSTDCNKGSNLLHEVTHKMGYGHSFKGHRLRPYSVPYSMNWVMRECCK